MEGTFWICRKKKIMLLVTKVVGDRVIARNLQTKRESSMVYKFFLAQHTKLGDSGDEAKKKYLKEISDWLVTAAGKGDEKAIRSLLDEGCTEVPVVSERYQKICQADPLLEILD